MRKKETADIMILGEGQVFSTDPKITGLNNNVIICGSSGCGKTVSVIEPRLIETFNSNLIVTVSKRRIVEKYKQMFIDRGYDVLDMNFVNPLKSTVSYDPLQYIYQDSDVTFLAESIIKANHQNNGSADPYWDQAATSLFSALIAFILETEENPTFTDVLNLVGRVAVLESSNGLIESGLDDDFKKLSRINPHSFAVTCWNSFKVLPIRTAGCVFSTLNVTVDNVFSPEIKKMIRTLKSIDFNEFCTKKTVLFVSTSAVNPSLNTLVNMFYAQAFKQMFEYAEECPNGQLPIPVSVLADDFAVGSRIANFPEYIAIFREKRISVTILLQSESQLERMYGNDDAISIIDNCDSYIYMGGMNLKTCRNIAEKMNFPLEDVLYMPIGQEIVFRRGQRPIITERYDILKNKTYQKITAQFEKTNKSSEKNIREKLSYKKHQEKSKSESEKALLDFLFSP